MLVAINTSAVIRPVNTIFIRLVFLLFVHITPISTVLPISEPHQIYGTGFSMIKYII
jgi:hypothetical protein